MKSNLVVARCGENSLHPHWLEGAEPDFDLVVTFYGETIPEQWKDKGYPIEKIKGPKWKGLYEYLTAHTYWKQYSRIFLPDDDLMIDAGKMNRLFALASQYDAPLCQPALDQNSYFSHPITLACKSFESRVTTFVELMCPCFSARLLELTLPVFQESASGWGMDFYWPKILRDHDMHLPMIFDAVAITHTRPVGAAKNGTDGSTNPGNEMRALFAKYQVTRDPNVTIAGVLTTGEVLDGSSDRDRLAIHLVRDAMGMIGRMSQQQFVSFVDEIVSDILPPSYRFTSKISRALQQLRPNELMRDRSSGSMIIEKVTVCPSPDSSSRSPNLHELLQYQDWRFVEAAYELLLARKPDKDGYLFYLSRLHGGVRKIQILKEISRSPEAVARGNNIKGLRKALRIDAIGSLPIIGSIFRGLFSLEGNSKLEVGLRVLEQKNSVLSEAVSAIASQQTACESRLSEVPQLLGNLNKQLTPLLQRMAYLEELHARDIQGLAQSLEDLRPR